MELHIDEEFQNLLPKLSDEEYRELEDQIKRDGVLNPIITWNGSIVDGHNRYMICKLLGITDFPIKEISFSRREDVIEWILKHQLGRRNLTDFQRTKIALRYEEMISKKARERQVAAGKEYGKGINNSFGSMEPKLSQDGHYTRNEVAKIAGTSCTTVMRTKYILEHGTEDQIARAEKGGTELDGRSNSIRAIADEIKCEKEEKKKCKECGQEKPLSMYYKSDGYLRDICKACYNRRKRYFDVKGNRLSGIGVVLHADEMRERLYNDEREVVLTVEDMLEEVRINGENAVEMLHRTFVQYRELLNDAANVRIAKDAINELVEKLQKTMEVEEDERI